MHCNLIGGIKSYFSKFYNYDPGQRSQEIISQTREKIKAILKENLYTLSQADTESYPEKRRLDRGVENIWKIDMTEKQTCTFTTLGIAKGNPGFKELRSANRFPLEGEKFNAIPNPLRITIVACMVTSIALLIFTIPWTLFICTSALFKIPVTNIIRAISTGTLAGVFIGPFILKYIESPFLYLFKNNHRVNETIQIKKNVKNLMYQIEQSESNLLNQELPSEESMRKLLEERNQLLRNLDNSLMKVSTSLANMNHWTWRVNCWFKRVG